MIAVELGAGVRRRLHGERRQQLEPADLTRQPLADGGYRALRRTGSGSAAVSGSGSCPSA